MQGKQADLVQQWAYGWAIDDYATTEDFTKHLDEVGFILKRCEDATPSIMRSARKLYRAYFLGWLPAKLYLLFNPNATSIGRNNIDTAYLQYKTLKQRLWKYMIVLAEKK